MPEGSVTLKAIADFSRMDTTLVRTQKLVQTLESRLKSMADSQARFNRRATTNMSSLARNALTVATTYLSIHQAINLVSTALRSQKQLADEAAEKSMSAAQAEQALVLATVDLNRQQFAMMRQGALRIGAREGLSETKTFQAFLRAFSGTEEIPEERIPRALRVFDRLARVAKSELGRQPELLNVALNLEKNIFAGKGIDPTQAQDDAILLMLRFLSQSPAVEGRVALPKFAQAVSAEISAARAVTPEQKRAVANAAAAMTSAVMSTMADPDGAIARTMVANLGISARMAVGRTGQPMDVALRQIGEKGLTSADLVFRGKAITKEMQKDIVDNLGAAMDRFRENMIAFGRPGAGGIETLIDRMEGRFNELRRANLGLERVEAQRQQSLIKGDFATAGITSQIVRKSLVPAKGQAVNNFFENLFPLGVQEFFGGALTPQQGAAFLSKRLQQGFPSADVAARRRRLFPNDPQGLLLARELATATPSEFDVSEGKRFESLRQSVILMQSGVLQLLDIIESKTRQEQLNEELRSNRETEQGNALKDSVQAIGNQVIDLGSSQSNWGRAGIRNNAEAEN